MHIYASFRLNLHSGQSQKFKVYHMMSINNLPKELSNSVQFSPRAYFLCSRKVLYQHVTRVWRRTTLPPSAASHRVGFRHSTGTTGKVRYCSCSLRRLCVQPMQAFTVQAKQKCVSHP